MLNARDYEPALMYKAIVPNTNAPGFGSKTVNLNGTTPVRLFSGYQTNPFNGSITGVTVLQGTTIAQTITMVGENGTIATIPLTLGTANVVFGTAVVANTLFTTAGSITIVSSAPGGRQDAVLYATFEVAP